MTHHKPHSFIIEESKLSDDLHDNEIDWEDKQLTSFEEAIVALLGRSFLGQGLALKDDQGTAYRGYDAPIEESKVDELKNIIDNHNGAVCCRPDGLSKLIEEKGLERVKIKEQDNKN